MSIELIEKIKVKSPYNVLTDIQVNESYKVSAKFENEYHFPQELGPLSSTEAGRHMAILGSMALANQLEGVHYFLAVGAEIKRHNFNAECHSSLFTVETEVRELGRKNGKVIGEVRNEKNEILYSAVIDYTILKDAFFPRLFKQYIYSGNIINEVSPYVERRGFTDIQVDGDHVVAKYGKIRAEDCEGHFHEFPALPVAIMANLFSQVAIHKFLIDYPHLEKGILTNAKLEASRLAFHGKDLSFRGKVLSREESDTFTFLCEALVDEEVVAKGESEIKGV